MRSCAASAHSPRLGALGAALALALALACEARAQEGSITLESLMSHMAATSGVRARFHEVKEIALLSEPLVSEGVLYYAPPRRLARFTTAPATSTFVIDGEKLSFRDEAGGDSVDLSQNAVARQVVASFLVLFSGDLPALRERYDVRFTGEGARWSLGLVPKDSRVRSVVAELSMRGDGPKLEEMVLREAEGDRTVTTYRDVVVDARFDEADLARHFPQDGSAPRP